MDTKSLASVRCRYYERNDWLKIDVLPLLDPWVDRVVEIFQLRKSPAKYLVTYALAMVTIPRAQEIMDIVSAIFEAPDKFQRQYGTRLIPPQLDMSLLHNRSAVPPLPPRKVSFMDLVDVWARPLNRCCEVPIIQARDVVKIAFLFILAKHTKLLANTIEILVQSPHSELFTGDGKVVFTELVLDEGDVRAVHHPWEV